MALYSGTNALTGCCPLMPLQRRAQHAVHRQLRQQDLLARARRVGARLRGPCRCLLPIEHFSPTHSFPPAQAWPLLLPHLLDCWLSGPKTGFLPSRYPPCLQDRPACPL